MRFSKHLLIIALSAALLSSCASSPTGRGQLVLKSDAALAAEGSKQFAMLRKQMPLSKDPATVEYVACVANAIVEVLEGKDAAMYWELAVIERADINAFVMPGGKISVFTGILNVASNQHQLAAVLGHEVAHVTARHTNERASQQMVAGFGVDVAAILLGGGYANQTRGAQQGLSQAVALGVLNPFSRGQESEADIIGLEYMAMAGFDPRESVQLWQNMAEKNKTNIPEFMSTHPSGETRIEQLIEATPKALVLFNEAKAQGKDPNCQR